MGDIHTLTLHTQKLDKAPISDSTFEPTRSLLPSFAASSSSSASTAAAVGSQSVEALVVSESVNLLDWGDSPTELSSSSSSSSSSSQLHLSSAATDMTPQKFQQLWGGLAESFNGKLLTLPSIPSSTTDIETKMRSSNVFTIASGALPNNGGFKFFLFCVEMEDILSNAPDSYLVQLMLLSSSNEATAVIKTTSTVLGAADKVAQLLIQQLR